MASSLVPPPPTHSSLANSAGLPAPAWARWVQQLWDRLHGGATGGCTVARCIVATSTSATTDFGTLETGDRVLVSPASAGNSHFVTVASNGTLPEAAVVGSLYVVLRPF